MLTAKISSTNTALVAVSQIIQSGPDRPVGQPLRKPAFKGRVGHDAFGQFDHSEHRHTEQHDPHGVGFRHNYLCLDVFDRGFQRLDGAPEHVDVVGILVDSCLKLLFAELQRALNLPNPVAGIGPEVAERAAGNLDQGEGFQDHERQTPFPQPAHAIPDRSEQRGHHVEGPGKTRLGPDPGKLLAVIVRIGFYILPDQFVAVLRAVFRKLF